MVVRGQAISGYVGTDQESWAQHIQSASAYTKHILLVQADDTNLRTQVNIQSRSTEAHVPGLAVRVQGSRHLAQPPRYSGGVQEARQTTFVMKHGNDHAIDS